MVALLNGTNLATTIKDEIQKQVSTLNPKPVLGVILVGDNPASHVYVNAKKQAADSVGIEVQLFHLKANSSFEEVAQLINQLNNNSAINGILMQLPLPAHLNEVDLISLISPNKDVDGLTPINQGKLFLGTPTFIPCTPLGIMALIKSWQDNIQGLNATVIGRSKLVGKPVAMLLLEAGCTVTITHSKTRDLAKITRGADILIAAVGKPHLVQADWVKPGACVIDVGITKAISENGTQNIQGDVDFESVSKIAGAITPVPGGVGPMTIAFLLHNVVKAYSLQ